MVGDTLYTDIMFGNKCNIDTLIVLTGNTSMEKMEEVNNGVKKDNEGVPTYYCKSLTLESE
jgi:ribonucleotide monophosphatase NagD (HAD superfamily)